MKSACMLIFTFCRPSRPAASTGMTPAAPKQPCTAVCSGPEFLRRRGSTPCAKTLQKYLAGCGQAHQKAAELVKKQILALDSELDADKLAKKALEIRGSRATTRAPRLCSL